jgi:uncharacterized membrane protein
VTPTARRRTLGVLLLASLSLNLFLVGFLAAHRFRPHPLPGAMLTRLVEELGSELSGEERATLQRVFHMHEPRIRDAAAALSDARATVRQALVSEPFEATRLETALAEASRRDIVLRNSVQAMLAEAAKTMSPEGRRHLAESRPLRR